MTRRTSPSASALRRTAGLFAGLALGLAVLTGCNSEGASTDCGVDACTVTFNRGVDARASVLGVEAKLVGVDNDMATIEVAGERLTLTVGQQATEVGGLSVVLESVTDDTIAVRIARN
ncbi:hypothetical protein [Micromonospora polyrhachis]|uniref:Uncharacterized protein n=1 Tax=Micromonospora polyrhachis TaxID=1282883 RepID=A0A7W7WRY6_9ACTN|nr:hypothetical protein [Micromonospora polyrhachis]MBB4961580.1 hypothetical protein [Micromonospora polyrhachis]